MQLSKNFSLAELTVTSTGIPNIPNNSQLDNLYKLANLLELVRAALGNPIIVSSGLRVPEVNKAVKGAKNSQHLLGSAADFKCPKFGNTTKIVDTVKKSGIVYDQLILEYPSKGEGSWVHISHAENPRNQTLIIDTDGTRIHK